MSLDGNGRPNVEEMYVSAGNTSDLTVEADRRGDGDVLIAAGWSSSRLGAALLRLHSEWDAAEKPKKPTSQAIEALAYTLPRVGKTEALNIRAATALANAWHLHELKMLLGKLKTLPDVRREVAMQAARWRMTDCQNKAGAIIKYWLDPTCHACEGRKWKLIRDTPALSNRPCHVCHASGVAPVPAGQEGRRLANYLDDCVSRARSSIKSRLHNLQK